MVMDGEDPIVYDEPPPFSNLIGTARRVVNMHFRIDHKIGF